MEGMRKAIALAGSQEKLAGRVGVTKQAVSAFLRTRVPAERVFDLCRAVDWRVAPYELRSDLYPDPQWLPPEARRAG